MNLLELKPGDTITNYQNIPVVLDIVITIDDCLYLAGHHPEDTSRKVAFLLIPEMPPPDMKIKPFHTFSNLAWVTIGTRRYANVSLPRQGFGDTHISLPEVYRDALNRMKAEAP